MLKSCLCNYSDAYILVKGTITVSNTTASAAVTNKPNKKVLFKNSVLFTDCTSKIHNTQVDDANDIDIVMPIYNLIEYSHNYLKTSESLWQYCIDKPAINNNVVIVDSNAANVTDSFNFKEKKTCEPDNNNTKNVEIMVPLK